MINVVSALDGRKFDEICIPVVTYEQGRIYCVPYRPMSAERGLLFNNTIIVFGHRYMRVFPLHPL